MTATKEKQKVKLKKFFKSFIETVDEGFVQVNEFSLIFYFSIAFSYILLFSNPSLYLHETALRISTEIIHAVVTVSFLLCTIFRYAKNPLYWINTLVLVARYIGLVDVAGQWHNVFNMLFIVTLVLYYVIVIAVLFAKRINEGGGPFDTALLAFGIFFILLWTLLNFEYKWMFIVGGGCCYLYALARVFKNVFYNKNSKELRLIQIIGNIIFYVTMIAGLPFFLEYGGVAQAIIQNTIIPIYAASIGGIMTLGGVAWTIKKSDKDRKEEEKKKYRPIVNLCVLGKGQKVKAVVIDNEHFVGTNENLFESTDKRKTNYLIQNCLLINTKFADFYLSGIMINHNKYYLLCKNFIDKDRYFGVTSKQPIYYDAKIESLALILHDLLGNEYKLPVKFNVEDKIIKITDVGFSCDIDTEECDERF